jgi:5-methylcytosine-specific restriction protein A
MPSADDFRDELHGMMLEAMNAGKPFAEINAGKLHRRVGDYPGRRHRMPVCCQVMRATLAPDAGDTIVSQPPKGQGASLTIRYVLPRPVPISSH